jgi:glutamate formiminotransferase
MIIHEFYYINKRLYVEFSTKEDGDDFYRILELDYKNVIYYSVDIIGEEDISEFEENSIIDVLGQYLMENDLPEQLTL